jgi:hypothetical protein
MFVTFIQMKLQYVPQEVNAYYHIFVNAIMNHYGVEFIVNIQNVSIFYQQIKQFVQKMGFVHHQIIVLVMLDIIMNNVIYIIAIQSYLIILKKFVLETVIVQHQIFVNVWMIVYGEGNFVKFQNVSIFYQQIKQFVQKMEFVFHLIIVNAFLDGFQKIVKHIMKIL